MDTFFDPFQWDFERFWGPKMAQKWVILGPPGGRKTPQKGSFLTHIFGGPEGSKTGLFKTVDLKPVGALGNRVRPPDLSKSAFLDVIFLHFSVFNQPSDFGTPSITYQPVCWSALLAILRKVKMGLKKVSPPGNTRFRLHELIRIGHFQGT